MLGNRCDKLSLEILGAGVNVNNVTHPTEVCRLDRRQTEGDRIGMVSDLGYVKTIVDWIESRPDLFDGRIYTDGFSQNAGFASFVAFCLSEKITGIWGGLGGDQCKKDAKEKEWDKPRPCFSEKGPVIACKGGYLNNYLWNHEKIIDGYECAIAEGHSPRLFEFGTKKKGQGSMDKTIAGGHLNIKNRFHWAAGCWGLTSPCSESCEDDFFECMRLKESSTAADRVKSFRGCIFGLAGECSECSPTLKMLKESEEPEFEKFEDFGAVDPTGSHERPSTSVCVVPKLFD